MSHGQREERFRRLIGDRAKDEKTSVDQIYAAAALGTYANVFGEVKDDLFRILKGMKPAEQAQFYTSVLKPLVAKTRRDVAELAKRFTSKPTEKKGKPEKKRKK